ncbi:MAG: sulfotransferase [Acidimicrobiia bacterium]|nr:sulfotransferase [Acidimicrobiia bacterium]
MERPDTGPPDEGSPAAAVDAMHEEARRMTGLDDFGDPGYLTALGYLLEALDRDADLSPTGQAIFRGTIVNTLANRLRSQRLLGDLADVSNTEIHRPIVITGLVRTGSTALHYLMGQDPELQSLPYWLAAHPQPRPPREEWDDHPDFKASAAELEFLYDNAPSLMAVHEMRADWPEECRHVLEQSFTDDRFEVAATVPTYARWYHDTRHDEAYRLHRRLVQLIGSTDPARRWLLKYPVHLRQLPALFAVYPDACIVQTHRDPCAVIASYTSFISKIRALHENTVDTPALARELVESWADAAEAGIAARDAHPEPESFFDLYFDDFMADPIGSVERICDHFDHTLTAEGRQQLEVWQREHPQGRHGRHEYDAEATGVTGEEIRDRFGTYLDRFGL